MKLEIIEETNEYALYEKEHSGEYWKGFVVEVKNSPIIRRKFHIAWNGERFAKSKDMTVLHERHEDAELWARNVITRCYPNVTSEIERISNNLDIPHLLHFTRLENLKSILKFGIYTRNNFEQYNIESKTNDSLRLDGHLDAMYKRGQTPLLDINIPQSILRNSYRSISDTNVPVICSCSVRKENAVKFDGV